jgi:hypothetical protein
MNKSINYRDTFLEKSSKMHKDIYGYSNIPAFFKYDTWVDITCCKHGVFSQKARTHASGSGCQQCAKDVHHEKVYNKSRHTLDQFISKSQLVHGNYYNYSNTQYVAQMKKLTIICPKHGPFDICANNHIHGSGCNKCKRSRGETLINEYLIARSVLYEVQKGFEDLRVPDASEKSFNHPKYDFYVPGNKLLIEFDGKQHFEPVNFRGITNDEAKRLHERTRYIDQIKNVYATEHGYNLLRIPYTEIKQLSSILDSAIQ